ncbi:gluconokinase [Georgenia sunbinii]|uniref:gluconokinase n=1 Tax=Georgenia sunbinii TaxID=3117728 RepID=UPI002F2618C9
MSRFTVEIDEALDPLVLALDVGSTASRGGVYDAAGRPVQGLRHKVPHAFDSTTDAAATIDPLAVLGEVEEILTVLAQRRVEGRIAAVGLDTFASSLVGVDDAGRPLTTCFTYADSRSAPQAEELRASLDEAAVHQRTGARLHPSYLPARLRWLRQSDPATFAAVRRWLSLGEFLHLHLVGTTGAGTSTAAWTGLLDRRSATWDPAMLDAAGIGPEQLSAVHHPDQPLVGAESRWRALAGATWFAAVADGYAANIGSGAVDQHTMVASAATSGAVRVRVPADFDELPSGLWCYRVDAGHSLLGGALNDVGRTVSWLRDTLRLDDVDLDAVLDAEPDERTPLVLPFLTGERSTGWASDARAVFAGVSAGTGPAALARGTLEGVALAYARVTAEMAKVAGTPRQVRASGRVSQDLPNLVQLLADAVAAPVVPVTIKRSTLHGTALLALETVAPGIARTEPTSDETREPVPGRRAYYERRAGEAAALYDAVIAR